MKTDCNANKHNDSGIAMVSVLAVMGILTTLSVATYTISNHSLSRSTQAQTRALEVSAAEAGLDLSLSMLGRAPLPCSLSGTLDSQPYPSTYTVAINYYDSYPATGSTLSCSAESGPVATPAAAHLISVGSSTQNGVTRQMEALVRLTGSVSGSLDKAMFSESSLAPTNHVSVYGNVGNDADIYTNGNYTCSNNQTIRGSVFAQGTLGASNNCTVEVDYFAKGNVTLSNSVSVGRDVKSSNGNISMSSNSTVNHDAIAFGTNTGGTVVNSRVSNASLAHPPSQVFPTVEFDATAWNDAGWTRQIDNGSNCSQTYSDIAAMSSQTVPTVIRTSCALSWGGNTTLSLGADLAIFATGGFEMSNNFSAQSTNSTIRKLYFIVPASAGTSGCSTPGITTKNNTQFASTLNIMFYTPCTVSIQNNDGGYGQIYAGRLEITNNFTLRYRPASIPTVTWDGGTIDTFARDLIYKRETIA